MPSPTSKKRSWASRPRTADASRMGTARGSAFAASARLSAARSCALITTSMLDVDHQPRRIVQRRDADAGRGAHADVPGADRLEVAAFDEVHQPGVARRKLRRAVVGDAAVRGDLGAAAQDDLPEVRTVDLERQAAGVLGEGRLSLLDRELRDAVRELERDAVVGIVLADTHVGDLCPLRGTDAVDGQVAREGTLLVAGRGALGRHRRFGRGWRLAVGR